MIKNILSRGAKASLFASIGVSFIVPGAFKALAEDLETTKGWLLEAKKEGIFEGFSLAKTEDITSQDKVLKVTIGKGENIQSLFLSKVPHNQSNNRQEMTMFVLDNFVQRPGKMSRTPSFQEIKSSLPTHYLRMKPIAAFLSSLALWSTSLCIELLRKTGR